MSKPVHVLLNEATREDLPTDDWEIILEITDKVNESPDESFVKKMTPFFFF